MALQRKAGPAQAISLIGEVPNLPPLPKEVLDRFPIFAQYQAEMASWWARFSDMFQRDIGQIQTQFTSDETAATSSISSIMSLITTLQVEVSALEEGATSDIEEQITAIKAQLADLSEAFVGHVAAVAAHGTTTNIVGIQDQQDLERKRLGLAQPGYGRFWPALGMGSIPGGMSVTIQATDFMLVAAPLTVTGNLTIDGTLLVL